MKKIQGQPKLDKVIGGGHVNPIMFKLDSMQSPLNYLCPEMYTTLSKLLLN